MKKEPARENIKFGNMTTPIDVNLRGLLKYCWDWYRGNDVHSESEETFENLHIIGSVMWNGTCDGHPAIIVDSYKVYGELYVFNTGWEKVAESFISWLDFHEEIKEFDLCPKWGDCDEN